MINVKVMSHFLVVNVEDAKQPVKILKRNQVVVVERNVVGLRVINAKAPEKEFLEVVKRNLVAKVDGVD